MILFADDACGVWWGSRFAPSCTTADDATTLSFITLFNSLYGTKTDLDSKMESSGETNFQIFRDCLSNPLIEKSSEQPTKKTRKARGGRKTAIKPIKQDIEEANDAEDLAEFIDVCLSSIYHQYSAIDQESST